MRIDRLLKVAELLEADAANPTGIKFDLHGWAKPAELDWSTYDRDEVHYEKDAVIPIDCNTAGCALGLVAISGIFKAEGFDYSISDLGYLHPEFGGHEGFDVAEAFFELPDDGDTRIAYLLFDADKFSVSKGAAAELEVARRIRVLCDKGTLTYGDCNI